YSKFGMPDFSVRLMHLEHFSRSKRSFIKFNGASCVLDAQVRRRTAICFWDRVHVVCHKSFPLCIHSVYSRFGVPAIFRSACSFTLSNPILLKHYRKFTIFTVSLKFTAD